MGSNFYLGCSIFLGWSSFLLGWSTTHFNLTFLFFKQYNLFPFNIIYFLLSQVGPVITWITLDAAPPNRGENFSNSLRPLLAYFLHSFIFNDLRTTTFMGLSQLHILSLSLSLSCAPSLKKTQIASSPLSVNFFTSSHQRPSFTHHWGFLEGSNCFDFV